MAKFVFGAGSSHTPLLNLGGEDWIALARGDMTNLALTLSDGRSLSYAQLLTEVGEKYRDEATEEVFRRKSDACQAAIARIANDLEAASPDVVIVVGDDQDELFHADNLPAISIYYGDEIIMQPRDLGPNAPDWRKRVAKGYAKDAAHRFPGHRALALELIERLIDREFDVSSASKVVHPEQAGFGHAIGYVVNRLFKGRTIPVIPVLLNTYFPPNVLGASRCFDLGIAIRKIVEESGSNLRVAVIASGGLSHFVVDADLDRRLLSGCEPNSGKLLRDIPRCALQSGSSEILNWIVVAGVMEGARVRWSEYQPIYRTPPGTGVGAAFLVWDL